ncbi:MAG: helix-turn-helix domain-containing protein, partial [Kiritimatiellae bacterium]|nr:helix-turn-helix domain-containing protein [Kiritimatiellia bacterium]
MIEFGETLRKAREAKGLTTAQIAEATHLMPQMVDDLENENFSKIVAPIYGRGFVKLYCETVGIDPKPLIAEFMDIYNGNRPPTIRMRHTKPAAVPPTPPPATAPAPSPSPVAEPPAGDPFESAAPQPQPEPESEPSTMAEPETFAAPEPMPEPATFAPPPPPPPPP